MGKKAYASDHSEHYHSAIEKIDGHVETMGGESDNPIFVFDSKEALSEAQGIVPVFLGREVMNKDGKHMLKVTGPKKEAFVNAGDLLRKYAEEFKHEGFRNLDPLLSGNPNMVDYRRKQEQMGYQPTQEEEEEEEYYRARNTSGNTENPWDFGSDEAGIWDEGYDAGYDAGRSYALQSSDDSYPMSYNPEDRGLY